MPAERQSFFHSLAFKTGVIIILTEVVILALTGAIYVNNFNQEIDQRIRENLLLPAALINKGVLELNAVTDNEQMRQLVREDLRNAFIVGINHNIFFSLNGEYTGRWIENVPEIDPGLLPGDISEQVVTQDKNGYYVAISPLFGADEQSIRFYLYLEAASDAAQAKKAANLRLFLLGSLVTVLATSLVILIAFNATIFHPLQNILAVFRQVETGDLTARASPANARDELGLLQRNLNRMIERLQQLFETLEQRVVELKQTSQALRQSEENYRGIFEYAVEGIYRATLGGRVLDANPAMARLLGYASPEALVASLTNVRQQLYVHPEERDLFLASILEHGTALGREFQFYRQDKQPIWVSVNARLVRRDDGEPLFIEGFASDISERKQSEREREALIAALETKNAELERFTYTVSHDLKSPLITIQGFLGYLKENALAGNTEQLEEDIARISNAAQKMHQLLGDLLELSRIGRLMNPPEETPLGDLIGEAMSLVAGRLAERGVEVDIAPNLPIVYGDRLRLREALENLLDNAVKYMGDQPQPRVEIGVRQAGAGNGAGHVFYVRDNGLGIDPRYHHKIFGLFDKLNPESEGTGVGLAIVKRIVEAHGGRIWVESAGAGKGSAFCFTLPEAGK